jgi:hypothetical protein
MFTAGDTEGLYRWRFLYIFGASIWMSLFQSE